MKRINLSFFAVLACFLLGANKVFSTNLYDPRCEFLQNPWGIDTATPRFSWKMSIDHHGIRQSAYQILAATHPDLLTEEKADLWNSGKVKGEESLWVSYAGRPLTSRSVVYWKVRAWDENDKPTGWTGTSQFSVGILDRSLWKGYYIGMERKDGKVQPMLRRVFQSADASSPAFLHISTLGYHEVYLNGKRVGNDVLAPSVVDFSKRHQAMTYNVTNLLQRGQNDLVIWLGGGWYNGSVYGVRPGGPYVMAQIDQQQGTEWRTLVATDDKWQVRSSGYYNESKSAPGQFGGELVVSDELLPDLTHATLESTTWQQAVRMQGEVSQQITPMMCEPNKIQGEIQAKEVTRFSEDRWMVDMGKSVVGWTRINFGKLQKGQRIRISYCDMLGLNGDFEYGVFTDEYIASGVGEEVFCNKFNYHAYRYIKIEGLGRQPAVSDIAGLSVYTGYDTESSFVCNDDEINAIHDMIHYTFKCLTLGGYMVDCPHLERMGYGGDGNASILAAQTMYDMYPLYRNWLQAYGDSQGEDGEVPHVAPAAWRCGGGPYWCAFIANAPWQTYLQYGDRQMLERYYPNMKRYLSYAEKYMPDGLLSLKNRWPSTRRKDWFLGDWALPNEEHQVHTESVDAVNSCSMSWVYGIMARVAEELGETADAALYKKKQQDINTLIHQTYYNKKDGTYATGMQLDMAFPLFVGATPEKQAGKVQEALRRETYGRFDGHLFAGLVGVPIVTQWLTRSGEAQMVYDMLKKRNFPGYLYMIENGATTTWEHWNAQRSRIHNCYNGIGSWFYQALAGIVPNDSTQAYRQFYIRPQMADGISFVRAFKPTPYGDIVVDWNLSDSRFDLRLTVPAGTTATVEIPLEVERIEKAPERLVRYGLIFNEKHVQERADTPNETCDPSKPLVLKGGKYRLIYYLKK